jgi:hypothetical protein
LHLDRRMHLFSASVFEWIYSNVADQAPGPMPLQSQKGLTHYNEMNVKLFDIDTNVWDITRNAINVISFHLFHGQSSSTYNLCYRHSSVSK